MVGGHDNKEVETGELTKGNDSLIIGFKDKILEEGEVIL
jgi:hypothetical protein